MTGIVKMWHESKGYGFLVSDDRNQPDVFVHISDAGHQLTKGDAVEFDVENSRRGLKAVNVRQIAKAQA